MIRDHYLFKYKFKYNNEHRENHRLSASVAGAEEKWIRESSQRSVGFLKIFKLTRGKQ